MKKCLSLLLVVVMWGMVFTACGSSEKTEASSSESIASETPVSSEPASSESAATDSSDSFDVSQVINVVSREDGSGTRGAFIELFGIEEKGDDGNKVDKTTTEAVIVSKTDVMVTTISSDPYSIGYVSLGSLSDAIKALNIDGTEPTAENVKNGSYKISRPFNIATKAETSEVTKDFIGFILSKEGQEVVSKSYISVSDSAEPYAGSKPTGKVIVAGSSSVTPIMEKLKEAYLVINPNATIEIQMSDSTSGMTSAIDGTCDIGMASRSLKDSEKETLVSTEIALDGIAVVVNNSNSVENLSSEQVKIIFTRDEIVWSDIIE